MTNRKNPDLFKTPYGFRITGFLLLFVFINVHVSAQRLSKSDKKIVTTVCDSYLTLKAQFLQDSSSERLKQIVTDSLFGYFELQKTYLQKMKYILHPNDDFYTESVNQIGQLAQCEIFNADTLLYTIELAQHDTGFVIIGFNQETDFRQYSAFYKTQIDSLEEDKIKKNVVRTAVSNFVLGLNQFYLERNSMLLRKTTTELNYSILLTEFQSDSIEGYPRKKEMVIREMDEVVFVTDSMADCHLSTNSGRSTTLNLIRESNRWIVVGENGHVPDHESYDELVVRLNKQHAIRFLSIDIDSFTVAAMAYFKHGTYEDLSNKSSNQVADVLRHIKNHLGIYNINNLRLYGFYIESTGNNVVFSEDLMKAKVTVKQITLTVEKKDIWRVTAIDSAKPFSNPVWMVDHFRDYTNALKIYIYPFDEEVEDSETDIVEVISVDDVDTSILGVLAHFKSTPRSLVTYEALFTQIDALTKSYTKNGTLTGQVYVQFVIEYGGLVNHVQISSSTNPALNLAALEILGKLPNWYPGFTRRGPVRSTFVLPINF